MSRSDVNIGLGEIICHFEQLEDPRSPINRHHPLPSVLTISLMGVLAGSDGPTAISKWAVARKDLLMQALDLPYGIPSRDVIRRVLSALKVDAVQYMDPSLQLMRWGLKSRSPNRSLTATVTIFWR